MKQPTQHLPGELTDIDGVLVHPLSLVHPEAQIGRGTRIYAFSQVLAGAVIGTDCTIGTGCSIFGRAVLGNNVKLESKIEVWDLVTIEDGAFIGPSVVFTNDPTPRATEPKGGLWVPTVVGKGASIGANATIICGAAIGPHSAIGAGSVVTKDVPPHALVVGIPARRIGWVCSCNAWGRLTFEHDSASCPSCGATYVLQNGIVSPLES